VQICVVTRDVPDNGVVVGIPAKVISYEGSTGYINNVISGGNRNETLPTLFASRYFSGSTFNEQGACNYCLERQPQKPVLCKDKL
jgi:hypothetical protein